MLFVLDLMEQTLRTMPHDEALDAIKPYREELPRLIEVTGLQDASRAGPIGARFEGVDEDGRHVYTLEPYTDPETGEKYGDPTVPWLLVRIRLWREVVESTLAALDSPPTEGGEEDERKDLMTDGEKRMWDALAGKILAAKELARQLISSEETVRQWKMGLCRKGYEIARIPSRGYYRPDAPPGDISTVT